ncbi:MarR family transcriptional regulator [Cereibacter sphaeroides]|nr:MarR family transcriptional regulator [Cereibacter sphaeroides]
MSLTSRPIPFQNDPDSSMGLNRAWFNLLRVQRSLMPKVARRLKSEGVEDVVWYEILLELERAEPSGLAMAEIERRLLVAQYALSRHVARIEARGWISRRRSPGQGRGQILSLTPTGRGMHDRIWQIYREAIHEELGARLSHEEGYALAALLIRLYP